MEDMNALSVFPSTVSQEAYKTEGGAFSDWSNA